MKESDGTTITVETADTHEVLTMANVTKNLKDYYNVLGTSG